MCSDDNSLDGVPETDQPAEDIPEDPADSGEDEAKSAGGWPRRKFLAAAALGTAAATFLTRSENGQGFLGGLRLGASPALAAVTCRAGDIEVTGGQAINEPCTCTGTFTPVFEFLVSNQNNSNRTCITLILGSPASTNDSDCTVLNGTRLLLKVKEGTRAGLSFLEGRSTDVKMIGTPVDSLGNPIQIDCNFTQCCFTDSIVAFKTQQNQSEVTCAAPLNIGDFPSAQCRKLTICLTGFGLTVQCADTSCAVRSLTSGCCSVPCGGSLNVKITAVGSSDPTCTGSLTISVKRPGETTFTNATLNASGCYVDSSPVQGTYTFRATDCKGCFREDTLEVCVSTITTPTVVAGTPNCSGVTTFAVTPCPPAAGVTYSLVQVDCTTGDPVITPTISNVSYNSTTCTFTATLPQGQTTCLKVKASNGNSACDVYSSKITVAVAAALSVGPATLVANPCSGLATFQAGTVSGGTGPFTFTFTLDNGSPVAGTGTDGNQFVYSPTFSGGSLNTSCHTLVVHVNDASGCSADSTGTTFSQCISTTTGCAQ